MLAAGQHSPEQMQVDQQHGYVGQLCMNYFQIVDGSLRDALQTGSQLAGALIGAQKDRAVNCGGSQAGEQGQNHGRARRVVPQVTHRLTMADFGEIGPFIWSFSNLSSWRGLEYRFMFRLKLILPLALCLTLSFVPGLSPLTAHESEVDETPGQGAWDDANHSYDRALRASAAGEILTMSAILEHLRALTPGRILDTELEQEDGIWVYEFKILTVKGELYELVIDARNGKVLSRRGGY
jgi:hypothetical protein